MPMISRALADLKREDLFALLPTAWTEDEQLDFKDTIPHKREPGHGPWRDVASHDARQITDHGRNQVLAALVAFAKSYGGDLLIGVRENVPNQVQRVRQGS